MGDVHRLPVCFLSVPMHRNVPLSSSTDPPIWHMSESLYHDGMRKLSQYIVEWREQMLVSGREIGGTDGMGWMYCLSVFIFL